jgi:hypothetical protein
MGMLEENVKLGTCSQLGTIILAVIPHCLLASQPQTDGLAIFNKIILVHRQ